MRWPGLSIRATVLASIVAGVVLPAAVVLALDRHFSQRAQQPIVERNRQAVMVLATAVLTEPAWTLSEPGLQAAMQRVLGEPSVCGIEVLDLQPDKPPLGLDRCEDAASVARLEAPVLHEGRTIARLRLAFDGREMDAALAERRRITAWLVAAQVAFGIAVLAGVLSLRLLRPIDALKRQAGSLAAREPAALPAWRREDELGELGHHLGSVQAQIRALIDELESKNAQLERLAMYDHLTGLPNRTLLRELFAHEAACARREQRAMALLFVDLDHFKTVNDQFGHAAGDMLLVATASRLRAALRASDIACRMGGDEFLVLLPRIDGWQQAAATAERLLQAAREPLALHGAAEPVRVGASVGVALYPADGADFDALVRAADVAMYRSKDLGRGRVSLYHPQMDASLRDRLALEREIATAAADGQLRLMLQPIVDAASGRIDGAEALVRWQHPQRGLLAPDAFIAVAESTGAIGEIGRWVLDAACAQQAALARQGYAGIDVGVNVSALQLHDPGFADGVRAAMRRHGVAPGRLVLELTESTLLAEGEGIARAVAKLREAGVQLAIDDFGTGYSSLAALKLVRPEWLKIDRSFVRDLPARADDCALAEAIFGMARALGIGVVAEGVETEAQRDWLLARGGSVQQGYLWSRPVPATQFGALLERAEA
ncbi:MAG: EAL domain-containing protein [Burkholderiales bacterium]|nr:EAL domain-containing protein [Burkholderiales bacterium]